MRLYVNQLTQQLQRGLPKLILLFGDEVYQQQQALDEIRRVCRQQGFDERVRFHFEDNFSWQQVLDETQALSLFASQKIIEVEMPKAKPGRDGGQFFKQWCELADNPNLLIVWGGKMAAEQTKTKWFKSLPEADVWYLPIYEIDRAKLPAWFNQAFAKHQLNVTGQATELLCDLFEGNLAGASQEVERLALVYDQQKIGVDKVAAVVGDQSRFTVFQLADDLLNDNRKKVAQVLRRLAGEELEPVIILWMLQKELDTLSQLASAGQAFDVQCKKLRIWENRKALYRRALQRLSLANLEMIQQAIAHFELSYKSSGIAEPYFELMHICALFSGDEKLTALTKIQLADANHV
ncbi:DNA polymerase III subunit delta [Gayadomonas joobiniege]|uniref:DNA polymerase III subunit delta n=1 Tax=Gayadomonas joobiniege TaxID=1234606 RepID=UPI000366E38D|nr:DNA polymerase III subunit delta [Gayadomonas joobiniege]